VRQEGVVVLLELALVLFQIGLDQPLLEPQSVVALLREVLEAEPQLVLVLVRRLVRAVEQVPQEDVGHLERPLVDRGADAALQHQLQHLGVRRSDGGLDLLDLFLHVLDGDLDGGEDDRLALSAVPQSRATGCAS